MQEELHTGVVEKKFKYLIIIINKILARQKGIWNAVRWSVCQLSFRSSTEIHPCHLLVGSPFPTPHEFYMASHFFPPHFALNLALDHPPLDPRALLLYPKNLSWGCWYLTWEVQELQSALSCSNFFSLAKPGGKVLLPSLLDNKHSSSTGHTNYLLLSVKTLK